MKITSKIGSRDRNLVYFLELNTMREQNKNFCETYQEPNFRSVDAFIFEHVSYYTDLSLHSKQNVVKRKICW